MNEESAKKRVALVKKKQELLAKAVNGLQQSLFEAVLGKIEAIAKTPAEMTKLFNEFTKNEHAKVIQNFASDILSIGKMNADYFIEAAKNLDDKFYPMIKREADSYLLQRFGLNSYGQMIEGGFIDSFVKDTSIKRQLVEYAYKAQTGGTGLVEFKRGFKELIVGAEGKTGVIEKYYNTFAFDTYQQADAALQDHYSKKLGLDACLYLGGLIAGSRPFCNDRNGKVFLRSEIEDWKKLEFAGKPANYNPLLDRGGYNCRHHYNFITNEMAVARRSDLVIDEDGVLRKKGEAAPAKKIEKVDEKPKEQTPEENEKEIEKLKKKVEEGGIAKTFDVGTANLEQVKLVVESSEWIHDNFNVKPLDRLTIGMTKDNANGSHISFYNGEREIKMSQAYLNSPFDPNAYKNYKQQYTKQLEEWEKMTVEKPELFTGSAEHARKNRKALEDLRESTKYDRWSLSSQYGKGATVTHEFGHKLHDELIGLDGRASTERIERADIRLGLFEKWERLYKNSKKNGDIYKVSSYAKTNHKELFAEAFTMLKHEPDKLPPKIKKTLLEILNYAAKQPMQ